MPTYQFKITPLENYFFGGEKHDEELKTNYFVESLPYPQQTTLLGMIRYLLLLDTGSLDKKTVLNSKIIDANTLIGEESFSFPDNKTFGEISSLSPLYFMNASKPFFFAPLDVLFTIENDYILKKENEYFNQKEHSKLLEPKVVSESGDIVNLKDIVLDYDQVGNEKSEKGKTKENAFYKQKSKRLAKEWSFCVNVTLKSLKLKNKTYLIPFGGEKSFFKIEVHEKIYASKLPVNYKRYIPFVFCESDCFVDKKLFEMVDFAVNDFVSFRNFRSKNSTRNHYAFKKDASIENGVIRSKRYQLLKRGSVLYFKDSKIKDEFVEKIQTIDGSSIGFNHTLTH